MTRRNRKLCVEIARDVLKQLRLKRYEAMAGVYVDADDFTDNVEPDQLNAFYKQSFKDVFKQKKEATCHVCALGSALVSLVNIKNACSVDDMCDNNRVADMAFDRLIPLFGEANIDMIESAFECDVMRHAKSEVESYVLDAAIEWGDRFASDEKRLRAIMLNIIKNNGDFKLPKRMLEKAKRRYVEAFGPL